MNIFKRIAAVFIGLMLATTIITLAEKFAHSLYPAPDGFDPKNHDHLVKMMLEAPMGSLIMIVIGFALASFFGSLIAQFISNGRQPVTAYIFGGILLLLTTVNFFSFPHPFWMIASGIISVGFFAWLGGELARKKADTNHA